MRHVGLYGVTGIPAPWMRFRKWMSTRSLVEASSLRIGIGHDDAWVTPPEKRHDACVVVPRDFQGDRLVNVTDLPGDRYYRSWLPDSGYEPDDQPCLELYRGAPQVGGRPARFRADLCVPAGPL